jgi:type IV pilus assembly protein PilX
MIGLTKTRRAPRIHARDQRGVALVVALILLLVATLLGLAASRGTALQERMSSNSYDRSLAFQRSEAALRAAEAAITVDWRIANLNGVDCSAAACPVVPANAFTGTSATWRDAPAEYDVNSDLTPATPQYHIAFMGTGPADGDLGQSQSAGSYNYGGTPPPDTVAYFRVTARSSNPAAAASDGRSIVVLQSTVKRGM